MAQPSWRYGRTGDQPATIMTVTDFVERVAPWRSVLRHVLPNVASWHSGPFAALQQSDSSQGNSGLAAGMVGHSRRRSLLFWRRSSSSRLSRSAFSVKNVSKENEVLGCGCCTGAALA
jgi:hypothetical protein